MTFRFIGGATDLNLPLSYGVRSCTTVQTGWWDSRQINIRDSRWCGNWWVVAKLWMHTSRNTVISTTVIIPQVSLLKNGIHCILYQNVLSSGRRHRWIGWYDRIFVWGHFCAQTLTRRRGHGNTGLPDYSHRADFFSAVVMHFYVIVTIFLLRSVNVVFCYFWSLLCYVL